MMLKKLGVLLIVLVVTLMISSCASVTSSYCLMYVYDSADAQDNLEQGGSRRLFQNDSTYECMCLDVDKEYCYD